MTMRLASFGVRGYVGQSLTPKVVMDFASAFGTFLEGGRVLISRDTRYSSPMLHSAVVASLLSTGCEVLDLGVCPTPIVQYSVKKYQAAGAVSITGGHTAMGWNALILIGSDGSYLEPLGGENVLDCFHAGDFDHQQWDHIGSHKNVDDFAAPYFDALEALLDTKAIRKAGFTVLVDPVGGAGCPYLDAFAERFGLNLIPINGEPTGYLAREPEPRPRAALQMASIIKQLKGDVGFITCSDMSRISLVSETGEPVSEEYTLPIIANHVLSKKAGTIITNCCTTRTVDDIAAAHKAKVVRCKVGQAYVVSSMMDEQAVLGGEGSGGVVYPEFSKAFDGFVVMGLVLEAMAQNKKTVSQLLSELPRYHIYKRKIQCGQREAYHALEVLSAQMETRSDVEMDLTDGVRLDWKDGWVHARASRTEQLVRVIAEAKSKDVARKRTDEISRIIEQVI